MRIALLTAPLLLAACGSPPEPADLYGMWSNVDDAGTVRVLEFAASDDDADLAGATDVYHIYNYAQGTAPTEVQRGTFVVAEGDGWELVTTATWSIDGSGVGSSFGNPIRELDADVLLLEIGDDGSTREYVAADALP